MVSPALAQSSVRVSGGTAVPLSPNLFTDASAPGATIEFGPAVALTDWLDLAVTLGHSRFPMSGTPALDSGAMTSWSASARLLVHMLPAGSTIRPYAIVGSGAHRLNHLPERVAIVCVGNVIGPCPSPYVTGRDDPEVRVSIQSGLGASTRLTPTLDLFAESTYTGLFSGDSNLEYVPVQLGIRYRPAP